MFAVACFYTVKVKSSMARSLPVKNLLSQNVGSIINYLSIINYPEWQHRPLRPGIPKVARSLLTEYSKSCDLQPALHCAIRGAQGVLPCVEWWV